MSEKYLKICVSDSDMSGIFKSSRLYVLSEYGYISCDDYYNTHKDANMISLVDIIPEMSDFYDVNDIMAIIVNDIIDHNAFDHCDSMITLTGTNGPYPQINLTFIKNDYKFIIVVTDIRINITTNVSQEHKYIDVYNRKIECYDRTHFCNFIDELIDRTTGPWK